MPSLNVPLKHVTLVRMPGRGFDTIYFEPVEEVKEKALGGLLQHDPSASLRFRLPRSRGFDALIAFGIEEFEFIENGDRRLFRRTPTGYEEVDGSSAP